MKNLIISASILALVVLSYGWYNAESRIKDLEAYGVELQAQVEAATTVSDGTHQFYRGAYASCVVLNYVHKVPLVQSAPLCLKMIKNAEKEEVHKIKLKGYDDVGDAPQLAPTPKPDRPLPGEQNG